MDMKKKKLDSLASSSSSSSSLRTKQSTTATGQPQCLQTPPSSSPQQTTITRRLLILFPAYYYYYYSSSLMSFSSSPSKSHSNNNNNNNNHHPAFIIFVAFLLLFSSSTSTIIIPTAAASRPSLHHPAPAVNQTFRAAKELQKINRINNYLSKINKPAVKTIQSPDGDLIDCVLTHLQPAFDHPQLRGQKPLEEAEAMMRRPNWKGVNNVSSGDEEEVKAMFQGWRDNGETCPEGTIPIRRTTERDILRSTSSIRRFGMKRVINRRRSVRRDSSGSGHEHAVVFVNGEQYYGAKASINVWAPRVTNQYEFSLSQLWLISGSFGNDLNTIEAGWQVSPELYGDNYPRFFTYWTTDAYQTTGCYNLLCSGFVQTNTKIAIGAAISPRSSYNGKQFDIGVMVWKDPKHGNWWLEFGSGVLIGYWPSFLFSHLRSHAEMVQFGGEIVNTRSSGYHTSTQMGSGHFAEEGFGKASYFRNLQVVDWDNNLLPLKNIHLLADHSNCYDIKQGQSSVWGTYFYYGGPGRNVRCP